MDPPRFTDRSPSTAPHRTGSSHRVAPADTQPCRFFPSLGQMRSTGSDAGGRRCAYVRGSIPLSLAMVSVRCCTWASGTPLGGQPRCLSGFGDKPPPEPGPASPGESRPRTMADRAHSTGDTHGGVDTARSVRAPPDGDLESSAPAQCPRGPNAIGATTDPPLPRSRRRCMATAGGRPHPGRWCIRGAARGGRRGDHGCDQECLLCQARRTGGVG